MAQQPAGFVPDGFEPDAPASEPDGAVSRFVSGAAKNLNPMGIVSAVAHPIDTAKALLEAHKAQYDKAKEAYSQGRYSEAVGHLGAAALPVLGPAAAAAGEKIGEGSDIAGGLGEGAGLIGSVLAPHAVPAVARGAGAAIEAAPVVARGAMKAGAAVGDFVEAHPAIGAGAGAIVGYGKGGLTGAVEGALSGGAAVRGMKLLKTLQKVQAQTGKVPPLEDIVAEVRKAPPEPFEPVLTPGEPPAPGSVTPKQLNEARLAEIRAAYRAKQAPAAAPAPAAAVIPPAAAEPSSELATRMRNIRDTPRAEGGALHYPGNEGMPQGPNLHDVAARTVGPDPAIQARYEWNPPPASAEQSAAAAAALEPIPLSKAVTAVRQASTAVKQKLTATEFTEATRLAKAGHPAESVLEAIQVQRALKGQSSFAGLPTDAEMRADMGNRARSGQKSLMAVYGDEAPPAGASGNPFPVSESTRAYKGGYPYDYDTNEPITQFKSRGVPQQGMFDNYVGKKGGFAGFFSEDPAVASRFAGPQGAVHAVDIQTFKRPLVIDAKGSSSANLQYADMAKLPHEKAALMEIWDTLRGKNVGKYDGIILKNTKDEGTVHVPLNPNQVKSAYADKGNPFR